MIIEKVWELKDKGVCDGIYDNVLFASLDFAIQETKMPAKNFQLMAEIAFNDGDFAALCTVDKLEEEYKRMLTVEPDEIDGIPRKEGEAYYSEDWNPPVSLPISEIKKKFLS